MSKERYEELKTKGWKNLEGEDRKEYLKLKEEFEGGGEEKITVTKNQLQEMIESATKKILGGDEDKYTTSKSGWQEYKPVNEQNQTATLRVYQPTIDDKPGVIVKVIDTKKRVWNEEEHNHSDIIFRVTVLYDDGETKEHDIETGKYIELDGRETVELIDVERKVLEKSTGRVMLNLPNNKGYIVRNMNSGRFGVSMGGEYEVDLTVHKIDEKFTIKRPNGQTYKMDAIYLNN